MAKLENITILTKRLMAVCCMSVAVVMTAWSQKPQTGFSDLRQGRKHCGRSHMTAPPTYYGGYESSYADEEIAEDRVWTNTSYLNLGYALEQQLKLGGTNYGYDSKWGAALQIGNSYMLPRSALFGMVKVGIDVTWFDLSGAQYDDRSTDRYHLTGGMGIGASLHVAPFGRMGGALGPLRVEGYCRFVPSYSVILKKTKDEFFDGGEDEKNDWVAHGAFLPVVSYGFAIDYRAIGIGYEHRWGNAKYSNLTDGGQKTKYDMTSNRIYISWRM